eukprot:11056756-Alexandrium_andersonii.AAC.1
MVESTARARISRATHTKSRVPGQARDYKLAELVGFHRSGGAKDTSGWKGPAKVRDVSSVSRGSITIRFQRDLPIEVRLQDVRRHL